MFEEVGITKAMRILEKYSDNTVYKCNPALLLRLISILLSFPYVWEETFQRFSAQLHDLMQSRQENSYLTTIARQIGPCIRSIAKVKERLEPRLNEPKELKDDRTEDMLKIYEDTTMATDTKQTILTTLTNLSDEAALKNKNLLGQGSRRTQR
ncbi:unnamed protein product [Coregonus sp. 'balchen']|nr:unnamed protein product [Coregonus sp. 'balchen']